MFSLIGAWINSWVNNREAGDLRRNRTHYDVIVMTDAFTLRNKELKCMTYDTLTHILQDCFAGTGISEKCVIHNQTSTTAPLEWIYNFTLSLMICLIVLLEQILVTTQIFHIFVHAL